MVNLLCPGQKEIFELKNYWELLASKRVKM